MAGGSSPRVRQVCGARVGTGHGAGGFRPGQGRGRGCGADGAFSGGLVPVFEHVVRGRAARGDRGVRVSRPVDGVRACWHGTGCWCSTTPRASDAAARTARSR